MVKRIFHQCKAGPGLIPLVETGPSIIPEWDIGKPSIVKKERITSLLKEITPIFI